MSSGETEKPVESLAMQKLDPVLPARQIGVPKMLLSLEEAKKRVEEFSDFKTHIIMSQPSNYVRSTRNVKQEDGTYKNEPYSYIRKPGWQLIDTHFGITHQWLEKYREIHEGAGMFDEALKIPHFTQYVRYRTYMPDGRFVEHEGACSTMEKRFMGFDGKGTKYKTDYGAGKIFHDTMATAETRCTNRNTSHIVGAGEVSAEEAGIEDDHPVKQLTEDEKKAREAAKNIGNKLPATKGPEFSDPKVQTVHQCDKCTTPPFYSARELQAHKDRDHRGEN